MANNIQLKFSGNVKLNQRILYSVLTQLDQTLCAISQKKIKDIKLKLSVNVGGMLSSIKRYYMRPGSQKGVCKIYHEWLTFNRSFQGI